jgi:hypothetical protein
MTLIVGHCCLIRMTWPTLHYAWVFAVFTPFLEATRLAVAFFTTGLSADFFTLAQRAF